MEDANDVMAKVVVCWGEVSVDAGQSRWATVSGRVDVVKSVSNTKFLSASSFLVLLTVGTLFSYSYRRCHKDEGHGTFLILFSYRTESIVLIQSNKIYKIRSI